MKPFIIATFYKFIPIDNYELMKEPLLEVMKAHNIKGTIILASEGVNGSFCGKEESVNSLIHHLRQYNGLEGLSFQTTFDDRNPFDKAKVKLRKEIVTLSAEGISPNEVTGIHLNPQEWNQLLADPEVVVIDTRNEYEIKLGTFQGAVSPQTDNFRDFPNYVEKNLIDKKDKKIAMFCTGGIRCEKSTSYLKKMGFEEVYQLKGGILNYLETVPEDDSKWEGYCFVFDERVALDNKLNGLAKGTIDSEWKNKNKKSMG